METIQPSIFKAPVAPPAEAGDVPAVNWSRVQAIAFYASVIFLITVFTAWGGSESVSWVQAFKAGACAAAGYVGGFVHRG